MSKDQRHSPRLTKAEVDLLTTVLEERRFRSFEYMLEHLGKVLKKDVSWPNFLAVTQAMEKKGYVLRTIGETKKFVTRTKTK